MKSPPTFTPQVFMRDGFASVVVFLVALPLCMGIAIASGVPPAAGLITGMVGGVLVGMIGGAPLQVSGPAAGLTVLVWTIVQRHGLEALGPIVIVAGALQIAAGSAKLGRWFQAVSPAVIQGMLAGIGALILLSQLHVMLDSKPLGSAVANIRAFPAVVQHAFDAPETPHDKAAMVGALSIGVIMLWNGVLVPRVPKLKLLPGALVAVVAGSVLANVLGFRISFVTVPDNLLGSELLPSLSSFAVLTKPEVIGEAFALALIASAETLLCAAATDRMHTGPRTNYDRELMAQGVGNIVCGGVGALPMTGVIVRSSANIEAGGTTRLSAVLHGVWLFVLVVVAPFVLRWIPTSALAAILVYTGYKLLKQDLRGLQKAGRAEVAIFVATVLGIVTTDLLKGVLLGFALATAKLIWTLTHLRIRVDETGNATHVTLRGAATFLRIPKLSQALEAIPPGRHVHIHLDAVDYVDHASLEALTAWEKQYLSRDASGKVFLNWDALEFRATAPRARPSERAPTSPSSSKDDVPPAAAPAANETTTAEQGV